METYKRKKSDKLTDVKLHPIFLNEFIKRFGEKLQLQAKPYQKGKYDSHFNQMQTILLCKSVAIDTVNFKSTRTPMIWITNGIWPCGLKTKPNGEKIFGRSFTIQFQLGGEFRPKGCRRFEEIDILSAYISQENMEDSLNDFETFLKQRYNDFFTKRINLNAKKRNLELKYSV